MNRIVLDTETANSLDCPLAYDIGWAVIDDDFQVLKSENFAVAEIVLDCDLMNSAYYAEKVPAYWDDIKNGTRKLARLATVLKTLREDIKAYGVTEIYAHNMRFDNLSTKTTERYLTCSKYRYFFPRSVKVCDTLKMSRAAFGKNPDYRAYCEENGYMTKHRTPRPRLTAEILFRYITNNPDFQEAHQGLADVLIEKEILRECFNRGVTQGGLWAD